MYKHVNYFSLLICWVQQTFELNTLTIREIKSLSLVLTVFKNQGRVSMRQNLGNYKLQRLQGSVHLCSAFPESSHKLPSCLSQASPVPTFRSSLMRWIPEESPHVSQSGIASNPTTLRRVHLPGLLIFAVC